MNRSSRIVATVLLGSAAGLGCSDTVAPDPPGTTKPPSALTILRLPADAPPLFNDSVAFYAHVGDDAEGFIYFRNASGGRGEKFARLKLDDQSLLSRPDGTPFGPNDSIRIVMRVTDPKLLQIEMSPAGLRFRPSDPAELRMEYTETDGDLDGDGDDDDDDDDEIERLLSIWRQERPGDPFVKLGTVKTQGLRELKADLLGFTRFAVAY